MCCSDSPPFHMVSHAMHLSRPACHSSRERLHAFLRLYLSCRSSEARMSAPHIPKRPFYAEYAWAFDLLIDRPVQQECRTIAAWLAERGVVLGATLLDAGCGTGRYAMELSRHGYVVHGIDRSPELVAEALRSADSAASSASFAVGSLLEGPLSRYDAILCRGVLNDFLDESDRASVFAVFDRALRRNGVLVLDVREWARTAARKTREPIFRKTVATERGTLTFTSVTELNANDRQVVLTERHALNDHGHERSSDYRFVMQC
jgi:2-polyprenyl-3-methyl-5-hydroxy-6-metoxy-1,4-benzoquinol methylase